MTTLNEQTSTVEKATFSMGCFWGPDSLFGSLPGVIQTVVGYAGGTTQHPTYRTMGEHSETIEITFDPALISYADLVRLFWGNHEAAKDRFYKERQYLSVLFYRNEEQYDVAKHIQAEIETERKKELQTEFQAYNHFYPAEYRHQKYFLRRFKTACAQIQELFPDEEAFVRSTIAARLNGFVRERGKLPAIKQEITQWGLEPSQTDLLIKTIDTLHW